MFKKTITRQADRRKPEVSAEITVTEVGKKYKISVEGDIVKPMTSSPEELKSRLANYERRVATRLKNIEVKPVVDPKAEIVDLGYKESTIDEVKKV